MAKFSQVLLISLLMVTQVYSQDEQNLFVTLKDGEVKGLILKSYGGRVFHAFKGIRYGKPAAGLLRFKPPVPVDPWTKTFDATNVGPECPQIRTGSQQVIGTEDCLVINVYVPQIENKPKGQKLPVLAYIHGGRFEIGTGSSGFKSPDKFMDHDIIFVSFNYRLGLFGFFNTENKVSPGNYGMLDQVLALKWIQNNIASFGGNPEEVTIFGDSAGASSVIYHLLSPLSEGLFKNAIAQSGSPLNPWSFQKEPLKFAKKVADNLKCSGRTPLQLYDCFKNTRVDRLVKATWWAHETTSFPSYPAPSIEGPGGQGFLTEDPAVLLKEGRIHNKVPFYSGFLSDEGYLFFIELANKFKTEGKEFLEKEFSSYFSLIYPDVDPGMTELISAVKEKYFGNKTDSITVNTQLIKMLTDSLYTAGITKTLDLFAEANVPTHAYKYTHKGEHSYAAFIGGSEGKYASHGDETLLQFLYFYPKMDRNDTAMSYMFNSLWATIASGRDPKLITENNEKILWKPYDTTDHRYLKLSLEPKMKKGQLCNTVDFWFETVPKLMKANFKKDEL